MRSAVNWAVLGLIVERPTYAYDLAQRFEHRYGTVLELSNIGHAYTAIRALQTRALVDEIPGTRAGRQPRPRYRATEEGMRRYREWLIARADEDRRRGHLFVLALEALAGQPEQVLEVMRGYEQGWLAEGMRTPIARERDLPANSARALMGRLIEEQHRLAVGAKLEWIEYARRQLAQLGRRA